jgi:hypothetical protein
MRSEAWRPAAAARNRSPREARDAPGEHYDSSLPSGPKTATVERREASVPRHGTQGASLGAWPAARYVQALRVPLHPNVSRRSAPLGRG